MKTLDLRKKKTSVWLISIVEGVLFVACLVVMLGGFAVISSIIHA